MRRTARVEHLRLSRDVPFADPLVTPMPPGNSLRTHLSSTGERRYTAKGGTSRPCLLSNQSPTHGGEGGMSRMSMCCVGFVLFSLALAGCGTGTDGLEPSPAKSSSATVAVGVNRSRCTRTAASTS